MRFKKRGVLVKDSSRLMGGVLRQFLPLLIKNRTEW